MTANSQAIRRGDAPLKSRRHPLGVDLWQGQRTGVLGRPNGCQPEPGAPGRKWPRTPPQGRAIS
eukprot:317579-Alexandrium_andersonii.AAC.1